MSETQLQPPPPKEEPPSLTWEEITLRYPEQYVILLDDKPATTRLYPERAIVFAHSTNRKELLLRVKEATEVNSWGIFFTGQIKASNSFFSRTFNEDVPL